MLNRHGICLGLRGLSAGCGLLAAAGFVRHGFIGEVLIAAVIPSNWRLTIFGVLLAGLATLVLLIVQVGMTVWLPSRRTALIVTTLLTVSWFVCSWFAADIMHVLSPLAGLITLMFLWTVVLMHADEGQSELVQNKVEE